MLKGSVLPFAESVNVGFVWLKAVDSQSSQLAKSSTKRHIVWTVFGCDTASCLLASFVFHVEEMEEHRLSHPKALIYRLALLSPFLMTHFQTSDLFQDNELVLTLASYSPNFI